MNKKYYLSNVDYYNTNNLLCSYYKVCYYLKKVALARKKPTTQKDLFNLYYSSLQNVVE